MKFEPDGMPVTRDTVWLQAIGENLSFEVEGLLEVPRTSYGFDSIADYELIMDGQEIY